MLPLICNIHRSLLVHNGSSTPSQLFLFLTRLGFDCFPVLRRVSLPIHAYGPASSAQVSLLSVPRDRKSTRLNSSHQIISYAVFCLKKKKKLILISLMPIISSPRIVVIDCYLHVIVFPVTWYARFCRHRQFVITADVSSHPPARSRH